MIKTEIPNRSNLTVTIPKRRLLVIVRHSTTHQGHLSLTVYLRDNRPMNALATCPANAVRIIKAIQ